MSETTAATRHAVTWFEIPTADFDRARRFYEAILETTLNEHPFGDGRIAVFAHDEAGVGGCLQERCANRPGESGIVIYLDVTGRLDRTLALVPAAGGSVRLPKTALPPGMGWLAQLVDSEGNRIGLHSST